MVAYKQYYFAGYKKIYLVFEHIDYDLKMLIERLRPKSFPLPYIKVI